MSQYCQHFLLDKKEVNQRDLEIFLVKSVKTQHQIPQLHLTSRCANFLERHNYRRNLGDSFNVTLGPGLIRITEIEDFNFFYYYTLWNKI